MKEVLDEIEVAALLDCTPETVQEKARAGELPAVKFGRSWRFPTSALLEALHRLAIENKPKRTSPPMAQTLTTEPPRRGRRTPLPASLAALPK